MTALALLPLVVVVANLASLATQLALPHLLPAREYALFSLEWAYGQVAAMVVYEWLRQPTMRFAVGYDARAAKSRRHTLGVLYVICTTAVIIAACLFGLSSLAIPASSVFAVVLLYAACQGTFDGAQALARAESANSRFSAGWLARTVFSLTGALTVGLLTKSGSATAIALAASFPTTVLLCHRRRLARFRPHAWDLRQHEHAKSLIFFGAFTAAAGSCTAFFPAIMRTLATQAFSLGGAAGVLLAIDVSQRVLSVIGLAVNVVVQQQSFRSAEFDTDQEQLAQRNRQVALPTALVIPAALGFFLIQPAILEWIVPADYRQGYAAAAAWSCFSSGVLAIRLFAIDPLFMMSQRPRLALIGPITTLACSGATFAILTSLGIAGPTALFASLMLGPVCGLVAAIITVRNARIGEIPSRELAKVLVASGIMGGAILALPDRTGITSSSLAIALGVAAYLAASLALNTCEVRTFFTSRAMLLRGRLQ